MKSLILALLVFLSLISSANNTAFSLDANPPPGFSITKNLSHRAQRISAVQEFNQGVLLYQHNQLALACQHFFAALQLDTDLKPVQAPLGQALLLQGLFNEALPHLQSASEIEPNNATNWCQLGITASHLKMYQRSLTAFQRYLQLEPLGSYSTEAKRSIAIIQNALASPNVQQTANNSGYLSDFAKSPRHWETGHPLRVFIDNGSKTPGFDSAHYMVLLESLAEWTTLSNGRINFDLVNNREQADICCDWTSDPNGLKSAGELGNTEVSYNSNMQILHANIILLTGASAPASDKEWHQRARSVALHEIGHALGLQHSKHPWDIMFPQVAPLGLEFEPSESDKKTLLALYKS